MVDFVLKYWIKVFFGGITAAFAGGFRSLYKRYKTLKQRNEAVEDGVCALLRAELIRSGEKYTKQGHCPIYAKDAYDKAFKAYERLGGNGAMCELHERVMDLSSNPPGTEG